MNVTLPVDAGNLEKVFSVTGVNAELNLGRPGMVDIVKADAVVQGIRVTAQGAFPIGQDDSGDFTLTAQDMAAVREQLNQVLNYMDRVKWPDASPPRLIVNLSDDPKGGVRIGMDLQAPFLRYGKIMVRDFLFNGDYADSVIMAKRFTMRDAETAGFVSLSLQADLKKRTLIWDVRSTAPLVSWAVAIVDEALVPKEMKFLSEPHVQLSGRAVFFGKLGGRGTFECFRFRVHGCIFRAWGKIPEGLLRFQL
ncbi:hypothetical protein [Akkermansia muciniphila]|uniref:hypothetical protein n=1 Tax=Akkermansia muciniphila TaxID=239935 RepID=UPI001C05FB95|nr:hypothetical protein [Akkermansia muciniphila]QWP41070.1 hypothetical protein J5W54_10235 [Akkermansia muciniphila]